MQSSHAFLHFSAQRSLVEFFTAVFTRAYAGLALLMTILFTMLVRIIVEVT